MALGSPEIGLEDGESQVVFILRGVFLAVLGLEEREMVIGVLEEVVGSCVGVFDAGDDLPDDEVIGGGGGGEREEEEEERESERERRRRRRHWSEIGRAHV